jgi:hypothetical protein
MMKPNDPFALIHSWAVKDRKKREKKALKQKEKALKQKEKALKQEKKALERLTKEKPVVMKTLYDDDDLGLGVEDMPTTGGQGAGFQERARQNYSSHGVTNMARHGRHGRPIHRGRASSHRRRYH